jgi:hypothetical protein
MRIQLLTSRFGRLARFLPVTLVLLASATAPAFPQLPVAPASAGHHQPAAADVPRPADVFGFEPGADYSLADYAQLVEYYRLLDATSDRVHMHEIGRSTRGLPMYVLFISSPRNLERLEHWRSISERLARARDLDDDAAHALAREGRAIVWIDTGLHSTEVATSQHAPLLAHHLASDSSPETLRILDDVVLLLMPQMNPDGHEIVVDWYRRQLGSPFEMTAPPDVYHEYVGHDINRDWFMITQEETRHVSRVLYHEWFPQIIYNHHQVAPFPARIFVPPFADPVNPNIPPLVVRGVNMVGEHMAKRIEEQGLPGVVSRMTFTMWWNGGMRTVPYFKNMVGLLSEVGHASATPRYHDPDSIPEYFGTGAHRIPAREPSVFYANPWRGGWARLGDAVGYHLISSLGALDIASRLREDWLYNIYGMGRDAILAGAEGGPFAYVIPADTAQWDAGEAVNLVNTLRRGGVEVQQAGESFTAGGRRYAAGSFVVPAAQAFRNYVVDLLERQEHPHYEQYPGGPPQPPYGGLSGWTLPLLMGVRAERIDEPFQFRAQPVAVAAAPAGSVTGTGRAGYLLTPRRNSSMTAVNRLLGAGARVSRATSVFEHGNRRWEAGTFLIEVPPAGSDIMERTARELGLELVGVDSRPDTPLEQLRVPRIGLYRSWTANMDEGWTRFVLRQHGFEITTLRDADIRGGGLDRFDIIVLADQAASSILGGHAPGRMPEELTGGVGETGARALRDFVENGGRILAFDAATDFVIEQLELPVRNAAAGVPRSELFVPGSVLRLVSDPGHAVAFGMQAQGAAFFQESRAFAVVAAESVEVIAAYSDGDVLLSGWEIGAQQHIAGRPAVVRVTAGAGDVVLIGFRPQFRAWPAGTYKLIFNAILDAASGS